MTLNKFTKDKVKRNKPTQWLVNVNLKSGQFFLNNLIADDLGLNRDCFVIVAYDEDAKGWFVTFDAEKGTSYALKYLSNKGYPVRYCFSNRKAATQILNEVKALKAATFLISRRSIVAEGKKWYRILHKQPIRVN